MTEVKRTNYATGQFLTAADFTREQDYHRTLRRLHNANLNSWGVAGGLDVTKTDDTHVQVGAGMALDQAGHEIVLLDPVTLDLAAQADKRQLYLTIAYGEATDDADKVQIGGVDSFIATTERPVFGFVDPGANDSGIPNPPPADAIVLALLILDGGRVSALNAEVRSRAGSVLAPAVKVADLTVSEHIKTGHVFFDAGALAFDAATNVMEIASIQNSANDQALLIHGRTINDGTNGTGFQRRIKLIDSVEVTGSLNVSALPGSATLGGQSGALNVAGRIDAGGVSTGSVSVSGDAYINGRCIASGGVNAGSGTFFSTNVVTTGYYGGTLTVNGDLSFRGRLLGGAKGGYVMDRFVNRLGESLEVGDVVVLGPNAPSLAYGPGDSIPVPEVDLTDVAGDTRVCGIVCEVHGESEGGGDEGGMRVFTDEERAEMALGTIGPGQLGHMVTLGTFAVCKVDADIAPIAAGDLLTTSPTRGHAQKVLDRAQATGAIVGKALAPLAKGRGTIPVLVTLH